MLVKPAELRRALEAERLCVKVEEADSARVAGIQISDFVAGSLHYFSARNAYFSVGVLLIDLSESP